MQKESSKALGSFLGEGTEFDGNIIVPHSIRIDGVYKGKIETTETITIGPSGIITADIMARNAIIGGKVTGNLVIQDRVELDSSSRLKGDIKTRDLVINEGATFEGNCSMKGTDSISV